MTALTRSIAGNSSNKARLSIFTLLKLFPFYLAYVLYLWCVSMELGLYDHILSFDIVIRSYALLFVGHWAVQFICSLGTTYGTRKFILWQIVSFVGIVAVHTFCLQQLFDPADFLWSRFGYLALSQLPFILVAHQLAHLIYILIARKLHKKGTASQA